MNEAPITLYRLQACPFCERVVRVLGDLGLEYESRFVEPLHSERDAVKRVAGVRTVPAIVDETTGVTMAESANIVEYLERTYGEDGPLATTDSRARAAAGEAATAGDSEVGESGGSEESRAGEGSSTAVGR